MYYVRPLLELVIMTMLNKLSIFRLVFVGFVLAFAMAGCGESKKEPNNENFTEAIQRYLDKKSGVDTRVCLQLSEYYLPFKVDLDAKDIATYDVLVKAGLLTRSEDQVEKKFIFNATEEGKKLLPIDEKRDQFCFGRMRVDTIDHSEKKSELTYNLNYTYSVQDVPQWMNNPAVRDAFPNEAEQINGPQKAEATLTRSNNGWRLIRYENRRYSVSIS